ncbi:MAG: AI-2E family transporter [Candidatus Pelagadaptatus aseana]|uniref:AI-2E family transporter n=1 Tax=Candidatus Pelagadaptatus aseana TaxID=3120508 RepID=UPI0039B16B65
MFKILRNWIDRYLGNEEAVLFAMLLIAAVVIVWSLGSVLTPVFAGIVIAFLLQGLVDRLKDWGMPHWASVTVTTLLLVLVLVITLLFVLPVIWQQSTKLIGEVPAILAEGQEQLMLLPQKYPQLISEVQINQMIELAGHEIGQLGQSLVSMSVASLPMLATLLIYLILVPILVFFFLKDKDQILGWLGNMLPAERPMMRQVWHEMNAQVANYVRGKVIEILVVGVVSCIAFALLGLKYALLMGLLVGLSVVIPYIGAALVTIPVMVVGFWQWGMGNEFYWLFVVYTVIQALDGNVLVPLLFSEAVNLHPVAIILAVLVFGGLWGFWGVFFAIPLATLFKAIASAWPVAMHKLEASVD